MSVTIMIMKSKGYSN